MYDCGIVELFPYDPRNDDSCIGPSEAHHVVGRGAVLSDRCHSWKSAELRLGVAHVAHPFVEESVGIGKIRSSFGKHLCVGCPSQTFVALRTVGRDREVVGALAPYGV